jgi:hypothetical protein
MNTGVGAIIQPLSQSSKRKCGLNEVLAAGYAPDLNDSEIEEIGQDPFLIAYALANPGDRTIVTK